MGNFTFSFSNRRTHRHDLLAEQQQVTVTQALQGETAGPINKTMHYAEKM
jgi:hypothetical protein